MWHAASRFVCGAIVLLAVAGDAWAQDIGQDSPGRASSPLGQPAGEPQERTGALRRVRAGLSEIFLSERLQIHVNGAYQDSSTKSVLETSFRTYGEQSRLLTHEDFRGGGHLDVGGSLRVWRGLVFGVSYTQLRNSGSASVTGTVPHPLDVGRDRTLPAQPLSLSYRQRAAHAYVAWRLPLRSSLEMELSAGPSYFSLRQGVVVSLTPMEVGGPPFSEVGLDVGAGEHTRNGAGFNAGVDITYLLTPRARVPQVGVGYFARVTSGSVSLPVTPETWRRVSVGGTQTGVGLRLRF